MVTLPMRLFLFMVILVAGCSAGGSFVPPAYTLTPPANPGGRMCTLQCAQAREYCRESCGYTHRQCVTDVQAAGMRYYAEYAKEQFATNQSIELRPRDFEQATGCDNAQTACTEDCESVYRLCFGNCGGTVERQE